VNSFHVKLSWYSRLSTFNEFTLDSLNFQATNNLIVLILHQKLKLVLEFIDFIDFKLPMVNNIFNFYFACAISLIFLIIFFFLALMVVFKLILNILFTYFASARFRSLISGAIWIQCVSGCLRMCDWYVRISRFYPWHYKIARIFK
jgi:hypothetical protein